MMWVLIAITILGPTPHSDVDLHEIGRYNTMTECFYSREQVLVKLEAYNGIPPINTQFVCVRTEYK
jgi:hypothetical protein